MASVSTHDASLVFGTHVTVVFSVDGRAWPSSCTVYAEAPLYLLTNDPKAPDVILPAPVFLVWNDSGTIRRGEAQVRSVVCEGENWLLEIKHIRWEDLENRKYPRHPIQMPVALRAVDEGGQGPVITVYQGTTLDLSLGGACVKLGTDVQIGSLVEVHAIVDSSPFRALGVVAYCDERRGGFGIEFLEHVGPSRDLLQEFLQKVA